MRRPSLAFAVLVGLGLAPVAHADNGLFPMADGAPQRGRGGTVLAIAEDAMCMNSNPAGLAFLKSRQLDLNFSQFFQPLKFEDPIQPEGARGLNSIPDTMPLVAGFGLAFREPRDLADVFGGTWRAITGSGEPPRVPSPDRPGEGQVAWNTSALPKRLAIVASGVRATLRDARIYAYYGTPSAAPADLVIPAGELPALPAGARVIGVAVDFLWQHQAETSRQPAIAVLEAGAERATSELATDPGQAGWRKEAVSIVLDQPAWPAGVALRVLAKGHELVLRNVHLRLGYRLGERYHWIAIDRAGPHRATSGIQVVEIAKDLSARPVDDMTPRTVWSFDLPSSLSGGATLSRIAARYAYDYTRSKSVANVLCVKLVADGDEVASETHQLTEPPRELGSPADELTRPLAPPPRRFSRFTYGLGVFPQAGGGIDVTIKTDLFPDGLANKSSLLAGAVGPSVAVRLTDNLAVGASLFMNVAQLELDGLVNAPLDVLGGTALPGIKFSRVFEALTGFDQLRGSIDMEPATTYGPSAKFGVLWKVSKTVSVGANYATQTFYEDFETTARVDFTQIFEASGLLLILPALIFLPNGGTQGLASDYKMRIKGFQLPQHAGVGVAWRATPWLRLSHDLRWIDWSRTMDALDIELTDGDNADVNALTGGDSIITDYRIGWRDMWVSALGAELFLSDRLTWRFGFNQSNNPVKTGFENPQIPALTRRHLTTGLSYRLERIDLHAAYSYGFKASVEEKEGASEISADFDFGTTSFGPQHVLMLGASIRF